MKYLTVLTVLIGIGLTAVSQNYTITPEQLKAIRLLQNQATTDSLLLIEKAKELDTLNQQILVQKISYENEINKHIQINSSKDTLVIAEQKRSKLLKENYKKLKTKLNLTRISVGISITLNLLFIYKAL